MLNGERSRKVEEEQPTVISRKDSSMATAWFGPCPHCHLPLSYLEGVTGSTLNPRCPRCKVAVAVERATFLMADYSRPIVLESRRK
jgi:hypothetical protein